MPIDLSADDYDEGSDARPPSPSPSNSHPLSWRLPPDASHSDWTVVIRAAADPAAAGGGPPPTPGVGPSPRPTDAPTEAERPPRSYRVHRAILSVGPRRSEYFAALFRRTSSESAGCRLSESDGSTSEITLERTAAEAFPAMLDHVYCPEGSLDVGTESAVALRHLGRYFGVRTLFAGVTEFIGSDLRGETAPRYLAEADRYSEDRIRDAAVRVCAENLGSTVDADDLCQLVSPGQFRRVVTSPHMTCGSELLSRRVAEYCRRNRGNDEIDGDFLREVTAPGIMPRIDPGEALYLLNLRASLGGGDDGNGGDGADGGEAVGGEGNDARSLRCRSLAACSAAWRDVPAEGDAEDDGYGGDGAPPVAGASHPFRASHPLRADDRAGGGGGAESREDRDSASAAAPRHRPQRRLSSSGEYVSLDPATKIDLLESSLVAARRDYASAAGELNEEVQRLRSALAVREREVEQFRVNAVQRSREIRDLLSSLRSKENEIQTCEMELGRYVRVPKEHRFPADLRMCTYAEDAADGCNDGWGVYGNVPPSSMPLLSSPEREGYLYRERGSSNLWPIFYYQCPFS